jgi:hypothetical protein
MPDGDFEVVVHRVPMPDTGIGIEQGFESDVAFLDHCEQERAKLDPEVRKALEDLDRSMRRALLGGSAADAVGCCSAARKEDCKRPPCPCNLDTYTSAELERP